jgi:hypothetical protein
MAAPSGGYSQLYWRRENVPGTSLGLSATEGLLLYFDQFSHSRPANTVVVPEITGTLSFFKRSLVFGPVTVTARLTFPMRHSGVHGVLAGWGLGSLTTTTNTHVAKTADAQEAATLTYVWPEGDSSTFNKTIIEGCRVSRIRFSCSVGQPVMCEMDITGSDHTTSATAPVAVPPDDDGFSPGLEANGTTACPMMMWHKHSTMTIGDGQGLASMVTDWEMEVSNPLAQSAYIGNSLAQGVPFRSDQAVCKARVTIDQDSVYFSDVLTAFGLGLGGTQVNGALVFRPYEDATHDTVFTLSNTYVVDPGGSTSGGYEPQRQTFELEGTYVPGSTNDSPEPLRINFITASNGPTGYGGGTSSYQQVLHSDS